MIGEERASMLNHCEWETSLVLIISLVENEKYFMSFSTKDAYQFAYILDSDGSVERDLYTHVLHDRGDQETG